MRNVWALFVVGIAAAGCQSAAKSTSDLSTGHNDLAINNDLANSAAPDLSLVAANDILGTLSGMCNQVLPELSKPTPSLIFDDLTFVAGEMYDDASLSAGGQILYNTPNAGGSSTESETMSEEVLHFCEGATFEKSETQIDYGPAPDGGANDITDLLVEIAGQKVGVSVTRAYKPNNQGAQTDAEIQALLEKKLKGVIASSARVEPGDKWVKQILHIFSAKQTSTDGIMRVWPNIDASIKADTIVLVTTTAGGGFVYCHPTPPLGQECP